MKKMLHWNMITALALLSLSPAALSQEAQRAPGWSEPLETISVLEGSWKVVFEAQKADGTWEGATGFSTIKRMMRGAGLIEEAVFPTPRVTFGIHAMWSYDKMQEEYRIAIIDDQTGLLDVYEGKMNDGKLLMRNAEADTLFKPQGSEQRWEGRIGYHFIDANTVGLTYESRVSGSDGAWNKIYRGKYTRIH